MKQSLFDLLYDGLNEVKSASLKGETTEARRLADHLQTVICQFKVMRYIDALKIDLTLPPFNMGKNALPAPIDTCTDYGWVEDEENRKEAVIS